MPAAGSRSGLALGTVQFGLAYGITGRGIAVPPDEVRAILEAASAGGIRMLDTAPAYGDIEERLAALTAGLPFEVISKIAPAPLDDAVAVVSASVARSRERLGKQLTTLLFHRADDLLREDGEMLWRAAVDAAGEVRVGVSAYDPATIAALTARFGLTVAQLPANAFDQRLRDAALTPALDEVELHARSVFLQGLLLMSVTDVAERVPAASAAHRRWTAWCREHDLPPIAAALAITRGLPGVRLCVVGVDRLAHVRELLEAADAAPPRAAANLACDDPAVIDPRRWTAPARTD